MYNELVAWPLLADVCTGVISPLAGNLFAGSVFLLSRFLELLPLSSESPQMQGVQKGPTAPTLPTVITILTALPYWEFPAGYGTVLPYSPSQSLPNSAKRPAHRQCEPCSGNFLGGEGSRQHKTDDNIKSYHWCPLFGLNSITCFALPENDNSRTAVRVDLLV